MRFSSSRPVSEAAGFASRKLLLFVLLFAALALAAATGSPEIMVIGGAEIYRQALPEADRIYLTEVHLSPDGDAHFPALAADEWREVSRGRG